METEHWDSAMKSNPKAPPRGRDDDLRFAPADETMTRKELLKRADRLVEGVLGGAGTRAAKPAEAE